MNGSSAHPGVDAHAALRLESVCKRFGALNALDNLSFNVRRGEIHGLIGPNGAGKTTAVNIATGYYPPTDGSVFMDGADVTHLPTYRRAARGLARSFQGARLFDKLDVLTNLQISIEQRRRCVGRQDGEAGLREEIDRVLAETNLTAVAKATVGNLPYGVRKQIEVARSCAFATTVLLLDEPTAGLSADEIRPLLSVLTRHRARLAILVIEHDMEVIMSLCDRITVLDAGNWLMTGTPAEVQRNPQVIAAYLGTD